MNAAPTTAALPNDPDPPPDQAPASAPASTRTSRVLGLLHKLINHGRNLFHTLEQCAGGAAVPGTLLRDFGTFNVVLILSCVVRGLRLAAALKARLVAHPIRAAVAPALVRVPADRPPRTAKPADQRTARPMSGLPDVPTAEDIAAALRHRPAGVVIAEICRDLGIVPSHPLWGEVMMVVTECGGSFVRLFKDTLARIRAWFFEATEREQIARPDPWPQAVAAYGTGPP
jgi:hypothetical protein